MSAPLPARVRLAAIAAMVLCAMVGLGAAGSMAEAVDLDQLTSAGPPKMPFGDSEYTRAALKAQYEAEIGALESMRASRVAVEILLSTCAAIALVSALRLLRPNGVPREGVRKMLGATSLACAVLRTLDGAQSTALAKKVGTAVDHALAESHPPGGYVDGLAAAGAVATSLFFTVIFVGAFLALSAYFGSAGVRAITAREAKE